MQETRTRLIFVRVLARPPTTTLRISSADEGAHLEARSSSCWYLEFSASKGDAK